MVRLKSVNFMFYHVKYVYTPSSELPHLRADEIQLCFEDGALLDRGNPPQAMPFQSVVRRVFPGFSQKPRMDVPQNR